VPVTDFSFIEDAQLRQMIERDKAELDKCLEHRLSKSTLVLAGSVIEAILVDYFLAYPVQDGGADSALRASLWQLLEDAQAVGLISQETRQLATVVKDYRNLIHPGREYRLAQEASSQRATVAQSVVEIVTEEVSRKYRELRGRTAEEVIAKVLSDPGGTGIVPYLVAEMSEREKERLLRLIPEEGLQATITEAAFVSLMEVHRDLKKVVPRDALKRAVRDVHRSVREKTRGLAVYYLQFYGTEVSLLGPDERREVRDYVLASMLRASNEHLRRYERFGVAQVLGRLMNDADGVGELSRLMHSYDGDWVGREIVEGTKPSEELLSTLASVVGELEGDTRKALEEAVVEASFVDSAVGAMWQSWLMGVDPPF